MSRNECVCRGWIEVAYDPFVSMARDLCSNGSKWRLKRQRICRLHIDAYFKLLEVISWLRHWSKMSWRRSTEDQWWEGHCKKLWNIWAMKQLIWLIRCKWNCKGILDFSYWCIPADKIWLRCLQVGFPSKIYYCRRSSWMMAPLLWIQCIKIFSSQLLLTPTKYQNILDLIEPLLS